ncbi:hypothetical protein [Pseudovibrio sp. Tun.PSC04-5.I4]|uniref:hypothetical protein n=1 Tax=Pseudovibrio sp. Tun.PSC04-5.I4 TaxID=1798213 RepID=UPI00088771C6|nr:hypothetical protein [Pseudovibrio sp. Tun.PSC04-5.I4]SDQ96096.1 hypothetical protein SAMN04515695_2071 [Pseudovibrio sp. Tun.PSC04-5.I4]
MKTLSLRLFSRTILPFVFLLLVGVGQTQAAAQSNVPNPVARAFLELLEERGLNLTFVGPVSVTDDVLNIEGIEGHPDGDPKKRFSIKDLALAQASLESDGRLFIGAFAASTFQMVEPDFKFTAEKIAITDLYLPTQADLHNPATDLPMSLYSTAEVIGLLFEDQSSGQTMPVERITLEFDSNNGDYPLSASVDIANIILSKSMFDPAQQAWLDQLGLTEVQGNIVFEGEWDGTTGELKISTGEVVLEKILAVQLAIQLNGLTDTVVDQVVELAAKGNTVALDLLQSTAVSSFSLSLINEGGIENILERQAHTQGKTRPTYINNLTAKMDRHLSRIPDKAKKLEFSEAFDSFLQNPQSITLSITPMAPVSVTQILGVSAISPLSLISLLGIGLEANVN